MLFVLAFDHRNSFRTDFFGLHGELTPEQRARCVVAKLVILDGLLHAMGLVSVEGEVGALIDDEYGREAVARAREAGVTVAIPVEKSGRKELEMEHDPFYAELEKQRPRYAKVLVRYNPLGDPEANQRQRAKLAEVQEWTRDHGMGFMLELLVPREGSHPGSDGIDDRFDTETRPRLTVDAVRELIAAGLTPELWKLEGMSSSAQYAAIAREVQSTGPGARCLVLGRGADDAAVENWLKLAAPVPGFTGFAVGRTIWWKPLRDYYDGVVSRSDAVKAIAANYLRLVRVYVNAASG